jgi:hypothetical protein
MEIKVTAMRPSDEITIRTHFSDYRFRVMDPVECKGVLSGGRLGAEQYEAVFVETIRPNAVRSTGQMEPGDRAVFLVGRDIVRRVTTSIITEIVLSEPGEALPADC